jgi:putative DNA primase/helicase
MAGGRVSLDRIPAELRERDQWVLWRHEQREGKPTKVPHRVDGHGRASTTDADTWSTFADAVLASEGADGIGYVFSAEDPYVGVDLDEINSDAGAIMLALDSYTERSVSGRGAHIIVKATLNGHTRNRKGPLEIYEHGRYFAFTGDHISGTPTTIEQRQTELEEVLAFFLPEEVATSSSSAVPQTDRFGSVDLDDQELLERAMQAKNGDDFKMLWAGGWQGRYQSQSEADLVLCGMLAFWTGRDAGRVDALFRRSGLMRPKWDSGRGETTYGGQTIAKAISTSNEVYRPSARNVTPTLQAPKTPLLEQRGVPSDFPGGCDLEGVLAAFGELLVMPDPGAVEVALAGIVANYAPGDVVWPLLVGPPGCGKSEIITATTKAPCVWSLSSLTPQTLLSGFERKGKDNRPPASMLLQIGSFGILAFKDLTTVLTMHREARAQIIGQLREVADGKTEKSFGNGLRVEWEGKLGLIAGVTPVIDEQHAFLAVMGERFLLYRMPEVTRRDVARRSLERRGREGELRDQISSMVAEFLGRFRNVDRLELPDHFTERLITLADIVTRARSGVARDWQTRDILYLPEPEAPTRLAKQIAQLMAAMLVIGVGEAEAWRLARKVGWDSVPAVRTSVINLLAEAEGEFTRAQIVEKSGLPETTVRRVVEDLVVLGLAEQRKEGGVWVVRQSDTARDYWDSGERA